MRETFDPLEDVQFTFKTKARTKAKELRESTSAFLSKNFRRFVTAAPLYPQKTSHSALSRLNLDTAKTKGKGHSNSTTHRVQTRSRTLSCEHLNKTVETVRSVRIPNISVPCAQVVRNIMKSARTPGSSGSAKGKEPYFEIVTPAAFDLTFEKVKREGSDDEDSDAASCHASLVIEEECALVESPNPSPAPPGFEFEPQPLTPEERLPNPHSAATSPISPTKRSLRYPLLKGASASTPTLAREVENESVPSTILDRLKRTPLPQPPAKPAQSLPVSMNPPMEKVTRPLPTPPLAPKSHESSRKPKPKALPLQPASAIDVNRKLPPLPSSEKHPT
ncbi:hypothetical protein L218DRAFT_270133 [Marasmius fiardii PR-910]|nr:hypothetical protein L218DRAFT_270133 [Marasmius fiardii PR-910]